MRQFHDCHAIYFYSSFSFLLLHYKQSSYLSYFYVDVKIRLYEHYIFLPEEPKARTKFLQDLIKNTPGTSTQNCIYSFRQSNYQNSHTGKQDNISWNNLCNLSFEQLASLQNKGYYKEGS